MSSTKPVFIPPLPILAGAILGSPIQQLRYPGGVFDCSTDSIVHKKVRGTVATTPDGREVAVFSKPVSPKGLTKSTFVSPAGVSPDAVAAHRWIFPKIANLKGEPIATSKARCEGIVKSWAGAFNFKSEVRQGDKVVEVGLRPPQIGAVYGVLAHWASGNDPCTVVLPTGTGKTETMLALLVKQQIPRLLVIVPTDTLRDQISGKFLSLGVLRVSGVIDSSAALPVVGTLRQRPRTKKEVNDFFERCNVVVTTMSVAGGCTPEVQKAMAESSTHLFIDEAHHIAARTWATFRRHFVARPIVQFTATPFRGDGKFVDGKVVFTYPVKKAQEEGYFQVVNFRPVSTFVSADRDKLIAQAAVSQLEIDLAKGHNHVVMARTHSVKRAEEVAELYKKVAGKHSPVLIHSGQGTKERETSLQKIRRGKSRVLVCVNMFGEGFDMPELKIAAMHDIHKGLAITLQFTGRFTRSRTDLGEASLIANIADADVDESLSELYSQGANWNSLLRDLSAGATGKQAKISDFLAEFDDPSKEIPLQNIFPKMSTVVFRTDCKRWKTADLADAVGEDRLFSGPVVNEKHKVLLYVTRDQSPVEWGAIKTLVDTTYHLFLVYWDEDQQLLFIHTSDKSSNHEEIGEAIGGKEATLISGERVYRVFHGVQLLVPLSLGLLHVLEHAVRFTMHVGADVGQGIDEAEQQHKTKANLFGKGFENGEKVTIGCSKRGRIWSYKVAEDIGSWVEWCEAIGKKLLDDSIKEIDVFNNMVKPQVVDTRPNLVPMSIEWAEEFWKREEDAVELTFNGHRMPLLDANLELTNHDQSGPLRFNVVTARWSATYRVEFDKKNVRYIPESGAEVEVTLGKTRSTTKKASDLFRTYPPVIRFEDGNFLEHDQFMNVFADPPEPFDRGKINVWNWSGVDVTKESQTTKKLKDSIQYRVIHTIIDPAHKPTYDLVFDDDDKGEVADVVAMRVDGDKLVVHLYHCKYAAATTGARVGELYEVCGQAQKGVFWRGDVPKLFRHLKLRDAKRLEQGKPSRIESGGMPKLLELEKRSKYLKPEFHVFIVQPGLSRKDATLAQLRLLATTQLYLLKSYGIGLTVIGSS